MIFVPLVDFYSDEARSQYVAGLQYTIKPTNHALRRWATVWRADGKVRFLDDEGRDGMARDAAANEAAAQLAGIVGVAVVADPPQRGFWQRVKAWL